MISLNLKVSKNKKRYLLSFFILILSLFIYIIKIPILESISLKINDFNFFLEDKKPHKDVVFLAVDEKSVNYFGRWPWDRKILAKQLEKLEESKLVILDMVFSEKTNKKSDDYLAQTFENLDKTICGFFLRNDASEKLSEEKKEILSESALERVFLKESSFLETSYAEINIKNILNTCTLNATFSTIPDSDGLYRRYPVAILYENLLYPSLGIQSLRYIFNKDIEIHEEDKNYFINFNDKKIDIDKTGFLQLNYYPYKNYNIVSLADLHTGKIKKEYFKDKLVIVGITEAGVSDIRATPLGQIPGPILHYTFLSNYLQDILLKRNPYIELFTIILLCISAFLVSFSSNKILKRAIYYIGISLLFFIISKLLFLKMNYHLDIFYPLLSFSLILICNELILFNNKEKESFFIKNAFNNYLSPQLVDKIIDNPKLLKLGGEKKFITVMFTDLRSFTSLAEKLKPEELIEILNLYFSPMTNIILKNKGTLDKYIGDAIMAFFNAPIEVEKHEYYAVKTALEMKEELKKINKTLKKKKLPSLHFGVGINSENMIVGNIGSQQRFDYSVIGDGVNIASRIESLNKNYNSEIIISENTYKKVKNHFLIRKLDYVFVKGKEKKLLIFEVLEDNKINQRKKELYEEALELFLNNRKSSAKVIFIDLEKNFNDLTAKAFLKNNFKE